MIAMKGILVLIFIVGCYLRVSLSLSGRNVCTKPSETNSSITVSFCCTGYIQNGDVCTACDPWKFGVNCTKNCGCEQANTNTCYNVAGECDCKPGYQGRECKAACNKGFFGVGCTNVCDCNADNVQIWNHVTGEYTCNPGYQHPKCTVTGFDYNNISKLQENGF